MDTKTNTTPSAQQVEEKKIHGVAHTANVMRELWERERDSLHPDELRWFSGASENALLLLENVSEILDGIACLVQKDKTEFPSGSFQNTFDLPHLLFGIAESVRAAQALAYVGSDARYYLS